MIENKIRHLEMLQSVITRMNNNSFLLKGWTVTIIVALLAFANTKEMNSKFIIIGIIPTLIFMFLDCFFLRQERLFRFLYNDVRLSDENFFNFTMDTKKYKKRKKAKYWRVFFSVTIWTCYIPIVAIILYFYINNFYFSSK